MASEPVPMVSPVDSFQENLHQGEVVGNPGQPASPSTTERPMSLPPREWNQTQTAYPQVCLHELFEAQARRTPESVAVADEQQQLTYRQLNLRANQVARHLRKRGVEPDGLVGVAVDRSVNLLVALLGIMKREEP